MFTTLLALAALTSDVPATGVLLPPRPLVAAVPAAAGARGFVLRSPLLARAEAPPRARDAAPLAQTRRQRGASAGADGDGAAAQPDAAAQAAANGAPQAQPAAAAPAAAEEEEPSIDLMRVRAGLTRSHRTLGIITWASLLFTVTTGTIMAINQPTVFGRGRCHPPEAMCVLGDFGHAPLTTLHRVSAFVTVGFYTATGVTALSMPDPERVAQANDRRGARLRLHRALAWVHVAGMVLQPILGILSVAPEVVGVTIDPTSEQSRASSMRRLDDFQTAMRTVHLGVGYVTFAALTTAMLVELLP